MNLVEIAQLVGVVSIFLIFCLKLYIGLYLPAFKRAGRAAILWFTIYVFFLFVLRGISFLEWATMDQLRIISGFATLIPLVGILTHLFLSKKIENGSRELLEHQL